MPRERYRYPKNTLAEFAPSGLRATEGQKRLQAFDCKLCGSGSQLQTGPLTAELIRDSAKDTIPLTIGVAGLTALANIQPPAAITALQETNKIGQITIKGKFGWPIFWGVVTSVAATSKELFDKEAGEHRRIKSIWEIVTNASAGFFAGSLSSDFFINNELRTLGQKIIEISATTVFWDHIVRTTHFGALLARLGIGVGRKISSAPAHVINKMKESSDRQREAFRINQQINLVKQLSSHKSGAQPEAVRKLEQLGFEFKRKPFGGLKITTPDGQEFGSRHDLLKHLRRQKGRLLAGRN